MRSLQTLLFTGLLGLGGILSACSDDAASPVCGDSAINAEEDCDDGNTTAGDGCSATCSIEAGYTCVKAPSACSTVGANNLTEVCGDGAIVGDEDCDDGNTTAGDGCGASCALEDGYHCAGQPSTCGEAQTCGDGAMVSTEECDDDNNTADDGCSVTCTVETGYSCAGVPSTCEAVCGDGLLTAGETCDDGDDIDTGNGCGNDCQLYADCGNGLAETINEECDDGTNDGSYGTCNSDCTWAPRCGDNNLDVGNEDCDDGNEIDDGNGCSNACLDNSACGNGVIEDLFETCDDSNEVDDDNGCSELCQANNTCGDGVPELAAEDCDNGANDGSYGTCNSDCSFAPRCGDNSVDASNETCDDGNTADDGNGCSDACQTNNTCGDGVPELAVEDCDNGTNDGSYNTCESDCTLAARCGDGNLDTGNEICDDGNLVDDGNGCGVDCTCSGEVCDGTCTNPLVDTDNCGACGTICGDNEACVGGVCCEDCNLLRGEINGEAPAGNARVVEIDGYDGVTAYTSDLDALCSNSWQATGLLCDEGEAFTDSRRYSWRSDADVGTTWSDDEPGAGVIVVDMGTERILGSFSVFQMFSDGRTDGIRFHVHTADDGTPPAWDDAGWAEITDWVQIGSGAQVSYPEGSLVSGPTFITLPSPVSSRYLRVDASSNGEYIELRSVKAFAN